MIAISGGGPYAAELAARAPGRIQALHLAAALPPYGEKPAYCALSDDALADAVKDSIADPRSWWAFPDDSAVKSIPGFADTAYEEGPGRTTSGARRPIRPHRCTSSGSTASVPGPTCRS